MRIFPRLAALVAFLWISLSEVLAGVMFAQSCASESVTESLLQNFPKFCLHMLLPARGLHKSAFTV